LNPVFRDLVTSKATCHCGFDVGHAGWFRRDDGHHDLSPLLVVDADHHGVCCQRDRLDRGFDGRRTNALSPSQDQLVAPAGDDQSSLSIHVPQITGSVRTDPWRLPEVPGRDRRAVEENLAFVEGHNETVEETTRGPERLSLTPRFDGGDLRAGLGHPVRLEHRKAGRESTLDEVPARGRAAQ
jgi:hypothetical protein